MSEESGIKVYELAKELQIDSISLLDKLKELDIVVKSHMSSLEPDQAQAARSAIDGKKAKKKVSKKASKKTASTTATPKTTKKTARKTSPARKKAVTKTATATATATATTTAVPAEASTEARAGKNASTIIRRRIRTADGTETVTSEKITTQPAPSETAAQERHQTSDVAIKENVVLQEPTSVEMIHDGDATTQFLTEKETRSTDEGEIQVSKIKTIEVRKVEVKKEPEATKTIDQKEATAKTTSPEALEKKPERPPEKRGLVSGQAKSALKKAVSVSSFLKIVKPDAPKKPLIIAKAKAKPTLAPAARPGAAPTEDEARGGSRIIRMTKEKIDKLAEEEKVKKRPTGKITKPEDARFADYRKKEVFFLPRKKRSPFGKDTQRTQVTTPAAHKRVVEMGDSITVKDLADQLGLKAVQLIKKLMGMGQVANINQVVDLDTATLVANEFGYEVKNIAFKAEKVLETDIAEEAANLEPRPPVVTVMGHVDHGKTSLLDAIKETNVVSKEAGGITQHMGAYSIEKDGKPITFIDTPGHAAFSQMRARGANVTDIVILVVAADDGVMPQTREAVSHAKAAGVPIVVAVNKMDKTGANPDRVMQGLSDLDLLAEEWGGETLFVPVSAIEKTNLDKLLEAVLLTAEMLELQANPNRRAKGSVLESRLERGRGPVATLLVSQGTLKVGDTLVAGEHVGKVRAMMNHLGLRVDEVKPGLAAEILGFESVPNAGDPFDVTKDETTARKVAVHRQDQFKALKAASRGKVSLEELFSKVQTGETKELKLIVKADVFGSVEAVRESLERLSSEKVRVNVIHSAAGGISESDVHLASASDAIIIGFSVRPETNARRIAENDGIEIKCYNIIYELIEDVKKAMSGLLDKKEVEKYLGRAEVRQTFSVPKIGLIAGSYVIDGKFFRSSKARLLRNSRVLYEGKIDSLRRFKEDAKEVAQGYECGIGLDGYNDIKEGDIIEAFEIEFIAQELD
jgi:translation initiation factor IF-2